MKKLLMTMLLVVGMLLGAGGCTATAIGVLTYGPPVVLGAALLTSDLDEPVEQKGGARFIEPDEPNQVLLKGE